MKTPNTLLFVLAAAFFCWAAEPLKPFNFGSEAKLPEVAAPKSVCVFAGLTLPADFSVFAAGTSSGQRRAFRIAQSGHVGTQMGAAINRLTKPVVPMLG